MGSGCYIRQVVSFLFIHWIPQSPTCHKYTRTKHISYDNRYVQISGTARRKIRFGARKRGPRFASQEWLLNKVEFVGVVREMTDSAKHFADKIRSWTWIRVWLPKRERCTQLLPAGDKPSWTASRTSNTKVQAAIGDWFQQRSPLVRLASCFAQFCDR